MLPALIERANPQEVQILSQLTPEQRDKLRSMGINLGGADDQPDQ